MRTRVLVLSPTYPPDHGGNARSCELWVRRVLDDADTRLLILGRCDKVREVFKLLVESWCAKKIIIFNGWPYRKYLWILFFFRSKIILNINNLSLLCGNYTYLNRFQCDKCTFKSRLQCSAGMTLPFAIRFMMKECFRSLGVSRVRGYVVYNNVFLRLLRGVVKEDAKIIKVRNLIDE